MAGYSGASELEELEARGPTEVWERWSDWNQLVAHLQEELVLSQDMLERTGRQAQDEDKEDGRKASVGTNGEVIGDMIAQVGSQVNMLCRTVLCVCVRRIRRS